MVLWCVCFGGLLMILSCFVFFGWFCQKLSKFIVFAGLILFCRVQLGGSRGS